jgi:hypothetical protein
MGYTPNFLNMDCRKMINGCYYKNPTGLSVGGMLRETCYAISSLGDWINQGIGPCFHFREDLI